MIRGVRYWINIYTGRPLTWTVPKRVWIHLFVQEYIKRNIRYSVLSHWVELIIKKKQNPAQLLALFLYYISSLIVILMMLPFFSNIFSGFYEGEATRNTDVATIQVKCVISSFAGLLDFKLWDLRFEISIYYIIIPLGPLVFFSG